MHRTFFYVTLPENSNNCIMKKLITTLVVAVVMAVNCRAEAVQTIIVNGTKVIGKNIVTMTFEGENAVLEYSDMTTGKAPVEQVCVLLSYDGTDVNGLKQSVFAYNGVVDDMLVISGIEGETDVTLYDATGKAMAKALTKAGETRISMKGMAPGVYIVKAGKTIVKISKK